MGPGTLVTVLQLLQLPADGWACSLSMDALESGWFVMSLGTHREVTVRVDFNFGSDGPAPGKVWWYGFTFCRIASQLFSGTAYIAHFRYLTSFGLNITKIRFASLGSDLMIQCPEQLTVLR